jgi:Domain of unknown function (DUF4173)
MDAEDRPEFVPVAEVDQSPDDLGPEHVALDNALVDPPPSLAELASLLGMLILADLAIYRGSGAAYAGWAALFGGAPVLLSLAAARRRPNFGVLLLGAMLVLLAARLVWCGSPVEKGVGLALLPCFAVALAGCVPYLTDAFTLTLQIPYHGARAIVVYLRSLLSIGRFAPATVLAVVIPLAIGAAFSLLFVMANPDLVKSASETLSRLMERLQDWFVEFSLGESAFLTGVGWITLALLRGRAAAARRARQADAALDNFVSQAETASRPLYFVWRNSLALVVAIYAVYLVFEFQTLWFRQFPTGFYYSGYAHEGAAWLTIALALATAVLSLIFRGRILTEPRLNQLKRLAWLWSIENLVLAAAVYNRLSIYVGFNGMTPMRILGFYGVSAVVCGFLLVMVKIARGHDLSWLLQRHLWTLGLAIYLYAMTPLDFLAMRYNVARILRGDSAPSVQISEHTLSTDSLLALFPLLNADDSLVKNGVAALLVERRDDVEEQRATYRDWTTYQLADRLFLNQMHRLPPAAARFAKETSRRTAWAQFKKYAYQWY